MRALRASPSPSPRPSPASGRGRRLAALAALALAGCTHTWASLRGESVVEQSVSVEVPGDAWGQATLSLVWLPAKEGQPERAEYRLSLERADGSVLLPLARSRVDQPDWRAFNAAELALRAAPDGHALLVSYDAGRRWRYAGLDAGVRPLFCPHLTLETANADPFVAAPGTRTVAADVLARPEVHPEGGAVAEGEREAALRYVGQSGDEGLLATWATWLLRPDTPDDPELALLPVRDRPLGDRAPLAQRILLGGLDPGAAPLAKRKLAARALARSTLGEVQDRLAVALVAGKPGDDEPTRCALRESLASTLRLVTASRAQASEATLQALERLALGEPGCPGPDGERVGAWAVLALAALPSEPHQHFVLEQAAARPCPAVPAWPPTPEALQARPEPGCWARAVLASAKAPHP